MDPADEPRVDYVFGYGSLVALREPLIVGGRVFPPIPGRLLGFRRDWGAAMNNWETSESQKHFLDSGSGLKPPIRVAYLDIVECAGAAVNGLAIPADRRRLEEFDVREVNYRRVEVSGAFRPRSHHRVFVYRATAAARRRGSRHGGDTAIHVSRQYVTRVRQAFRALGPGQLEEYERTTEPLDLPARDLELRYPPMGGPA